jgi:hypothetical protein
MVTYSSAWNKGLGISHLRISHLRISHLGILHLGFSHLRISQDTNTDEAAPAVVFPPNGKSRLDERAICGL